MGNKYIIEAVELLESLVDNQEYCRSGEDSSLFLIDYEHIEAIEAITKELRKEEKEMEIKNKKQKKIVNILGKIKNTILITGVLFSILFLFGESFIYNSYIYTFILKLVCLLNIYCFVKVNSDYIINS